MTKISTPKDVLREAHAEMLQREEERRKVLGDTTQRGESFPNYAFVFASRDGNLFTEVGHSDAKAYGARIVELARNGYSVLYGTSSLDVRQFNALSGFAGKSQEDRGKSVADLLKRLEVFEINKGASKVSL